MKIFDNNKIIIDLPVLIDSRMLICANSGGGKSYAIRKLLEEAGNGVMSIILDVEGEFKTLREKFDYLLIGQAGDVPVNTKAAHLLPHKLMELNVSAIIDISDLKMHERILYVKRFLEALMELPRKFWRPCLVVVDEAHMYCGQQEKQDSTRAVIDLMTRGRKRGYCGILATQRIAKLHKDAAAEANNYMVGRTGLDVDMKRASEILGFASKADMLSLRNLDAGEFYVFGTAISRGVEKTKVSKVKTTHPQVGMDLRGNITPPTAKIKAILSKLNDLPKEAETKAKTIKEFKQRIRDLERKLKRQPVARVDEQQLKNAEQRGYAEAKKEQIQQARLIQRLQSKLKKINELATDIPKITKINSTPVATVIPKSLPKKASIPQLDITPIDIDIKLVLCERKICSVLYNHQDLSPFTKKRLGVFTEYAHSSGSFNNALAHLNSLGLINRSGNQIELTEEGIRQIPDLLNSDLELCERIDISNWQNHRLLGKCERAIFRFLLENPDQEFSKQDVGENTEPPYAHDSGSFHNAVSKLNTLGLIQRCGVNIKLNEEILEL